MLSFLLTATNVPAYVNHTYGHAKFTTYVGGGEQGARRIGRERGTRGRKGKHWEVGVLRRKTLIFVIYSLIRILSNQS